MAVLAIVLLAVTATIRAKVIIPKRTESINNNNSPTKATINWWLAVTNKATSRDKAAATGKVATKQQALLTEAVIAILATKQSAVTATIRAKGIILKRKQSTCSNKGKINQWRQNSSSLDYWSVRGIGTDWQHWHGWDHFHSHKPKQQQSNNQPVGDNKQQH